MTPLPSPPDLWILLQFFFSHCEQSGSLLLWKSLRLVAGWASKHIRITWERRRLSALYKLLRPYWIIMDIYQGIVAQNGFKSHTNSWCPFFFFFLKKSCPMRSGLKFPLSYVTWFLPDNMSGPKEIVFRPVNKQK